MRALLHRTPATGAVLLTAAAARVRAGRGLDDALAAVTRREPPVRQTNLLADLAAALRLPPVDEWDTDRLPRPDARYVEDRGDRPGAYLSRLVEWAGRHDADEVAVCLETVAGLMQLGLAEACAGETSEDDVSEVMAR